MRSSFDELSVLARSISTIKTTSAFKNVSVTVGVVDELALHGKSLRPQLVASTGVVLVRVKF